MSVSFTRKFSQKKNGVENFKNFPLVFRLFRRRFNWESGLEGKANEVVLNMGMSQDWS